MSVRVVTLPGDGIGVEVTAQAVAVLRAVDRARRHRRRPSRSTSSAAPPSTPPGRRCRRETLAACRRADAVLLGAVGGPQWDHLSGDQRTGAGLLGLRAALGVFANLRPVRVHPRLVDHTALRPEVVRGVDLVVVRELTGGAYYGQPRHRDGLAAVDTIAYSRAEIERVARVAFALAARAARPPDVGRQGQRAHDQRAVARDGQRASPPSSRR